MGPYGNWIAHVWLRVSEMTTISKSGGNRGFAPPLGIGWGLSDLGIPDTLRCDLDHSTKPANRYALNMRLCSNTVSAANDFYPLPEEHWRQTKRNRVSRPA